MPLFDRVYQRLCEACTGLPVVRRDNAERCADGYLLFERASEFTHEVSFVLGRCPEAYPDLPAAAASITAQQESADGYLSLHLWFTAMARVCLDAHQFYQAAAVREGRGVLDRVVRGARSPDLVPDLPHRRRLGLLEQAFQLLREVRQRRPRKPGQDAAQTGPSAEVVERKRHAAAAFDALMHAD